MSDTSPYQDVLLVDDEPGVLLALKLVLETLGFKIHEFQAPESALEYLRTGQACDLIICDYRMPGISGLGVLQQTMKLRPALPFLLMSGHATKAEVNEALTQGAMGFLAKPFSMDQLKTTLFPGQGQSANSH